MVLRARADVCLQEFLPHFMQSDYFMERAIKISVGSLSPTINWSALAGEKFEIPPLDEQRRIADLLWAADDACEKHKALLEKANELRIPLINELMGVETPNEVVNIITEVSKTTKRSWKVLNVEDICTKQRQGVQVGPFGGSVSSQYFSETGVPVLKINNITDTGELDFSDMVFLNEEHAKTLSERYSVEPGDVVTAAQATIGRTAIVTQTVSGAIISQHLIRIAVDKLICLPEWLHACFQTPLVIRQMYSVMQGGTRAGLNTNDVKKIRVPIPPLEDQKEFCKKISAVAENANNISAHLNNSRTLKKQLLMKFLG